MPRLIYAVAMLRGAVVLAVVGCGFRGNAVPDAAGGSIDAPGDDAALDGAASTFCNPIDGLVACYEFEGNAADLSGHGHDASPSNVLFVSGISERAMLFAANSAADVAASAAFDVHDLTIEAWVEPSALPAPTKQSVILDVDMQYALFINDDGTVTCDLKGLSKLSTTTAVALAAWSHVACTYDHSKVRVYVNGDLAANHDDGGDVADGGHAMAIAANSPSGSPLIGTIDELRLMSVARSGPEICSDAGRSGCL